MYSILVFGDVFGKIGRRAIATVLPVMRERYNPTYVLANGENLAHGAGLTESTVRELLSAGVDAITGGNHSLDKPEGAVILADVATWRTLRPANMPEGLPGTGSLILAHKGPRILVVSLMGQAFFRDQYESPFAALDAIIANHANEKLNGIVVDFHAEASAEAVAFGYHATSRVSAVVGTHTHVGTTDARVLPQGTAYVTDIGMVGAEDSIIGAQIDPIVSAYREGSKPKISPVEKGMCRIGAVLITLDEATGHATDIRRVDERVAVH